MATTFAVVRTVSRAVYAPHSESFVDFGPSWSMASPWIEHSWSMATGLTDEHGVKNRRYRNPPRRPRHTLPEPLADWERELLGEEPRAYPTITFQLRNER